MFHFPHHLYMKVDGADDVYKAAIIIQSFLCFFLKWNLPVGVMGMLNLEIVLRFSFKQCGEERQ